MIIILLTMSKLIKVRLLQEVIMNSKGLDYTALAVVIIGAINWGLIGFLEFDLVAFLFGNFSWLSRIIYAVVGICGLYSLSIFGRIASMNRD